MAGKNMTNKDYEKEQVRIMKERAAYLKAHPEEVKRPKGREVGKPTKWDKPKKK